MAIAGDGGHIWLPRYSDPRIQALIDTGSQAGNYTAYGVMTALAEDLSVDINAYSIDDLWHLYKIAHGITDTSEPFELNVSSDPDFASVVLLSHFDGTNGQKSTTDETGNHTWVWPATPADGLSIETASGVFGQGLGGPDKTDYISAVTTAGLAFGTGDFTIEFIFHIDVSDINATVIYDQRTGAGAQLVPTIYTLNGSLLYHSNGVDRVQTAGGIVSGGTYRVAVTRISGTTRLFLDGVLASSVADTTNLVAGSTLWLMTAGDATKPNNFGLGGWIDELRVTKGVGRYSATYAVATEAFPNS